MLRLKTRRLALAIALGATAGQAYAFGLGGIKVQSALGQPLRAEIDITQLSADEAASLKVGIAPPDAFRAARLQYSSALAGINIKLERAADGRPFLRVTSSSPINEPFIDLLIRAQWSSGQLTRDYTLLLDPPNFQPAPTTAQIPVQTPVQTPSAPAPAVAAAPSMPPAPALQSPVTSPAKTKTVSKKVATEGQYVVKRGDTLSKIAAQTGVEAVSLDQMLTALYRANQSAFIDGNINLLKAGAVLQIPSAEQAQTIPQQEARRFVLTQSENFNAYRRRLAEMGGQTRPQTAQAQREASGKVQAQVQEPTTAVAQEQSKLKLSKAEVAGQGAASKAQQIAEQKQAALDEQKIKQLEKNVEALKALSKQAQNIAQTRPPATAPAPAAAASKPAAAATLPATSPVPAAASKPAAAPSAPAVAASSAPTASTAAPAASAAPASKPAPAVKPPSPKPAPPRPAKPAPVEQQSVFDSLMSNPLLLPAGGGVLILLLLLAWLAQRKKASRAQRDVSVFDSRMSVADSFFGGTGGERVDTRNGNMSSAFSSSQIDTNDVDPVAEADVYLAYGRDLQAEEILKEAIKANPDRLAARLKLLEIYAKRKDARSFEVGAAELFALTQGVGEDWKRAQDLGRSLDPVNPLYHNTVIPSTQGNPSTMPQTEFPASNPTALAALTPQTLPSTEMLSGMDGAAAKPPLPEHLDLDLSLPVTEPTPPAAPKPTPPEAAAPLPDIAVPAAAGSAPPAVPRSEADDALLSEGLDFHVPSDFGIPASTAAGGDTAAPAHDNSLDFDLSSISLPGAESKSATQTQEPLPSLEPAFSESQPSLDLRLELAAESMAIGDVESARNLLGEVMAEGDPQLKKRAQDMLDKLGR
ncbi:MAG: FimV/HubP family polar landmark protein [Thiomonas sp.]